MRVLAIITALLIVGCITTPDFWTCDAGKQKDAAKFLMSCETEFSAEYCMNRMRELYCKPGYKEQVVEDQPNDTVEKIIKAAEKGFESSADTMPQTEEPKEPRDVKSDW